MVKVLRHNPELAHIQLDKNGWANVDELIYGIQTYLKKDINFALLVAVVETDKKRRFRFGDDRSKIRASQGHTVSVDLEMPEAVPPEILYHGTAEKYLPSIMKTGINKKSRNFVHLTAFIATAFESGKRHGTPVVLVVDGAAMRADGYKFYLSENGVWQSLDIPRKYIKDVRYS